MHSFDIFDTTLARSVLAPSDVFRHVAHAIQREHPSLNVKVDDFVSARVEAERRARYISTEEEITLVEIWALVIQFMNFNPAVRWSEYELKCEEESLYPLPETVKRIRAAQQNDERILFISDTYLPEGFIRGLLDRHQLLRERDGLYISSTEKKTKASGTLFKHVLIREKLEPSRLVHYGDHPHSDVSVPLAAGIRAVQHRTPALSRTENTILAHDAWGAFPVRNVVAASVRFRTSDPVTSLSDGVSEYVGSFLGPFCVLFAHWAMSRARATGIKRLYFAARDCQMVWKAAEVLSKECDGPDCRYLHVSRRSLLLASVTDVSEDQLSWLRRGFEHASVERLFPKLGLIANEWRSEIGSVDLCLRQPLCSKIEWDRFWRLVGKPHIARMILTNAENKRKLVYDYLVQEGMDVGTSIGIVDLGWYLNCQSAIRKILSQFDSHLQFRGYYLGLHQGRKPPIEAGDTEALFYTQPDDLRRRLPAFAVDGDCATILEHVVGLSDHSGVTDYTRTKDGAVLPVLDGGIPRTVVDVTLQVQHEVIRYARMNRNVTRGADSDEIVANVLKTVILGFLRGPTAAALNAVKGVQVEMDSFGGDHKSLFYTLSWSEAIRSLLTRKPIGGGLWSEAAVMSTPSLRRKLWRLSKKRLVFR